MIIQYDAQRNERCAYVLPEAETPFGMTLGNYKAYASSTPKGGIRGLWDADTDQIIFGTHQIAYRLRDRGTTLFPYQIQRTFTFMPHAQLAHFDLDERVRVTESFYVPHGTEHDRAVAFVVDVTLENRSAEHASTSVFPWALLVGQRFYGEPEKEVHAAARGSHVRIGNLVTGASRFWGASRAPDAVVVSLREAVLQAAMGRGTLREDGHLDEVTPALAEYVGGRIFGAFEFRIDLPPGAVERLRIACVYHRDGDDLAQPLYETLLADPNALGATEAYYAARLADARFLTPSPEISRGVVWARANMLRIVKEYPQGWGSTNSPPSDILVSRDTSWFVHGYDYFMPDFSRAAIEVFNDCLEPSGQVVEYVRGVSGFKTSYDLNINDDTPLHLIAMLHHYNATLDDAWVRRTLGVTIRVADYLLSQRDQNGLVFCNAKGVDMYGISSWRNIIPYYTLDGAVTEINAEAVFALEAAATLCAVAGDTEHFKTYGREATALREKMLALLFNVDTTGFVLNYDKDQHYQDNFTADEVFPVLFDIATPEQRRVILERLSEPDFTTPVGLRTISTADSWYFPSHGFGLLGGVWPDLTLWFAVALARNGFADRAAHWLAAIYGAMEAGAARNCVPGQFAEWFDGGSLTNRGMYMSPWTGAKYLWAVAETVGGLDGYRTSGRQHFAPQIPAGWRWVAGVRVRRGAARFTYVIDVARARIICDQREASAEEPYRCVDAGRDVTTEMKVFPAEVGAVAFEDEGGGVRLFLCNHEDAARRATYAFRDVAGDRFLAPGELVEIALVGTPLDRDALPTAAASVA